MQHRASAGIHGCLTLSSSLADLQKPQRIRIALQLASYQFAPYLSAYLGSYRRTRHSPACWKLPETGPTPTSSSRHRSASRAPPQTLQSLLPKPKTTPLSHSVWSLAETSKLDRSEPRLVINTFTHHHLLCEYAIYNPPETPSLYADPSHLSYFLLSSPPRHRPSMTAHAAAPFPQ